MVYGRGDVILVAGCSILDTGCWMMEAELSGVGGKRAQGSRLKAESGKIRR
jgi:hypothetical protein